MKKLLIIFLVLVACIAAKADTWTDTNGTVWSFYTWDGNKATITSGISGTIPANLVIPSTVYIGETPYTVTLIGGGAFRECETITSVTIPDGVTSIESEAFSGCANLATITIPDGVTSIGHGAFWGCASLAAVTLPESIISIDGSAFYGCSNLTSINIPDGVTSIGSYAFYFCSSLTSINIPESVTKIEGYAFYGCSSLTSINIPDGVTSIGDYAFYFCSSLTSITIPENVTSIGSDAFQNCYSLTSIYFASSTPKTSYSWPSNAILFVPDESVDAYKTAWTDYANRIVPETSSTFVYDLSLNAKENSSDLIDQIGDENAYKVVNLKISGTFNGYDVMVMRNKMTNLRTLDMSEAHVVGNPYNYYSSAYDGSFYTKDDVITGYFLPTGIVSVKLPAGITALESYAFRGCSSLKSIELPEGITSIPDYAFHGCSSLTAINIPESVTLIGEWAFYQCSQLAEIHLPKQLHTIGGYAFRNTRLVELHLPPYIESIGNNAFTNCSNLKKIYAYMPGIIPIGGDTFNDYQHQELYIPEFLYNNYYYDTNWSQFISVNKTSLSPDDYVTLPTNDDLTFADGEERIPDTSEGEHIDAEIGNEGGVTVEGDEPQPFDEVEQSLDGNGQGGSLIGEDDGKNQGNLPVNTLNVKIQVEAGRWYFFCFPFDVTIAECEYPGQYAWREYDGLIRAMEGANGWKNVEGETLTARQGYIFQSATAGTLVVKFDKPTFGGDRPKTLTEYVCDNAANASWNFVGNPYSSFYDFKAEDFDAPITVWNGNSYEAYRPGDDEYHLQPYEAFFVQKPNESEKIDFKKEKRETYRQSKEKKANNVKALLLKGITPSRLLVNLNISDNDTASVDKTRLVLNEKASRNYEMTCDAAKFISNDANAQLYTVEEKVEMAINERPTEGDIRLGYKAKKAGKLTIEAPRMDLPMELVDTKTGVTFDLSLGSYEFQTEAGTFNTRFMLRPTEDATAIKDITKKTGVAIGLQNGGLSIGGAEGKDVKVFTTGGALAAQHAGNGYVGLPSGTYIVAVDGMKAKVHVK